MPHPFDYAWALLKQWEDLPENWGDEPPPEATPWEDLPEGWGEPRTQFERLPPFPRGDEPDRPPTGPLGEYPMGHEPSFPGPGRENYAPKIMQPTPDFHTPPQHKMPSWWGKDSAPQSFQDTYDPDTGWDMP